MIKRVSLFDKDSHKKRLRAMREVLGQQVLGDYPSQPDFAKLLNIPFKRWNEYERGYPLPTKTLFLIRAKFEIRGLIEWIMFGDDEGLPPPIAAAFKTVEKRLIAEERAKYDEARKQQRRIRVLLKKRDSNAV